MMINKKLRINQFSSRNDLEIALIEMLTPVYNAMKNQNKFGRVCLGDTGAVYESERAEIEGFLRTLWGLGPLFTNEQSVIDYVDFFTAANRGIIEGTNPNSEFFWGELHDYDQLFVEMGALSTYLILTKSIFWDKLNASEKENIFHWLNQINEMYIPKNNWLFFRILVNTFFERASLVKHSEQIDNDISEIHSYYLDEGWYFDGYPNQIDYYIPFGMHYYGLLYGVLTSRENNSDVSIFKERSAKFGKLFKEWFTSSGASLPFGRSLTYRFAHASYWAVVAVAGVKQDDLNWNEVKFLFGSNMRYWMNQPIFTNDQLLSIGYGYPNLLMAEGYNSPGSPYWALKSFILLALDKNHSFWTMDESVPNFELKGVNKYSRMLNVHSDDNRELQAFTVGQHSHEHAHGQAKYEKFVYSTTFGFSVPKGNVLPKQGAFDSTLAVSESEVYYQTPYGYQTYEVNETYTRSIWQPFSKVKIETFIIPLYPWHLRIYKVQTNRELNLISGGFSASVIDGKILEINEQSIYYSTKEGTIGIETLDQSLGKVELQNPEPNTNVFFSRTALPIVKYHLHIGKVNLVNLVLGAANYQGIPNKPKVIIDEEKINVQYEGKEIVIELKDTI